LLLAASLEPRPAAPNTPRPRPAQALILLALVASASSAAGELLYTPERTRQRPRLARSPCPPFSAAHTVQAPGCPTRRHPAAAGTDTPPTGAARRPPPARSLLALDLPSRRSQPCCFCTSSVSCHHPHAASLPLLPTTQPSHSGRAPSPCLPPPAAGVNVGDLLQKGKGAVLGRLPHHGSPAPKQQIVKVPVPTPVPVPVPTPVPVPVPTPVSAAQEPARLLTPRPRPRLPHAPVPAL
jgi:hypothetical protein